jgi:phospholipid-translocating ATPase
MERLESNGQYAQLTSEHLGSFANDGLRTLCLGYRLLTTEEYDVRMNKYTYISAVYIN